MPRGHGCGEEKGHVFKEGLGSSLGWGWGVRYLGGARLRAGPVGRSGESMGVQVGDE